MSIIRLLLHLGLVYAAYLLMGYAGSQEAFLENLLGLGTVKL